MTGIIGSVSISGKLPSASSAALVHPPRCFLDRFDILSSATEHGTSTPLRVHWKTWSVSSFPSQVRHLSHCSRTRDFLATARTRADLVYLVTHCADIFCHLQQNTWLPLYCTGICRPGLFCHFTRRCDIVLSAPPNGTSGLSAAPALVCPICLVTACADTSCLLHQTTALPAHIPVDLVYLFTFWAGSTSCHLSASDHSCCTCTCTLYTVTFIMTIVMTTMVVFTMTSTTVVVVTMMMFRFILLFSVYPQQNRWWW